MSCLFDTLSIHVGLNSNILRQKICDYLEENPNLFEDISTQDYVKWVGEGYSDLESYVTNMRNSSTWGGAIEIKAFCNMFNVNVNVNDKRGKSDNIEFLVDKETNTLNINWNGGHYYN